MFAKTLTDFREVKDKFFFIVAQRGRLFYNPHKNLLGLLIVMQKYYLNCSLSAAREMINAYYVERNVDKLFEYINLGTSLGAATTQINPFSDAKSFRKYAEDSLSHLKSYNLIDENYSIGGQSQDSCSSSPK